MWYGINAKKDIRKDLISGACRMDGDEAFDKIYHKLKLKSNFIDWLFRHYYTHEFAIHYFDADQKPVFDADGRLETYTDTTWDERIASNNWIDVFGAGMWDMNRSQVDKLAKMYMDDFRKYGHLKGRCWIGNRNDFLHIYLYGRDIHEFDMHFIMLPRNKRK